MSQPKARCQYAGDEYKPAMVDVDVGIMAHNWNGGYTIGMVAHY